MASAVNLILPNFKELLDGEIVILSLSLTLKLSVYYWSQTSPHTVFVHPESRLATLKVSASKESIMSSISIVSIVLFSIKGITLF